MNQDFVRVTHMKGTRVQDQNPRPASLPSRTHFIFLPIIPPGDFI